MPQPALKPFWNGPGQTRLYQGDALAIAKRLPTDSVHCIITSPPYWGQRDYGVDEQIGAEEEPETYVESLFTIFKELNRVLRDDGTIWLNLGDKYLDGELLGLPWRVAIELQRLYTLRQDIIWSKPDPMPSPVANRCVTSHEYLFLFSKDGWKEYYFDHVAIQEDSRETAGAKANKRSVWTVAKEPFEGAHFAPFPQRLVEPALLAGCPEKVCGRCGSPYRRKVAKETVKRKRPNDFVKRSGAAGTGNVCANSVAGVVNRTLGWEPGCNCAAAAVGGLVLDPFVGSGTTLCVALANGRRGWGIDLSQDYLSNIAIPRIEGTALGIPDLASEIVASRNRPPLSGGTRLAGGATLIS